MTLPLAVWNKEHGFGFWVERQICSAVASTLQNSYQPFAMCWLVYRGKKKSEKWKINMLKWESGGVQRGLDRTRECHHGQGCCMQHLVCPLVFWSGKKGVSPSVRTTTCCSPCSCFWQKAEKCEWGEISPCWCAQGGRCCLLCHAGRLGCPLWLGIQVPMLSSAMCMVSASSSQTSQAGWCPGKYHNMLWFQGLMEAEKRVRGQGRWRGEVPREGCGRVSAGSDVTAQCPVCLPAV